MSEQDYPPGKHFSRTGYGHAESRWRLPLDPAASAGKRNWSGERLQMPVAVEVGQFWSTWVPGRQQWLLATVIGRKNGQATLKYDARYGIGDGFAEQQADESTMLSAPNLFRFIEPKA